MQTLFFTVKEWNRFDWNKQQVLTKKYTVILTDYKTRKEKILQVLNQINFKNFHKGIDIFNKMVQDFGNSMDKITKEIDNSKKEKSNIHEKNLEKIWETKEDKSSDYVKIWSDSPKNESEITKDKDNLEKLWGKRK